jgi:chorismate mutase/prephenate dehydratase
MEPSKGHDLRAELLELDRQLLGALERRAALVRELLGRRTGTAKSAPTLDREHLLTLVREASALSEPAVVRAFELIDGLCRAATSKPRVACVGAEGELAWSAAVAHFGLGAELTRVEGPLAAIVDVAKQRVDFAVVPFESMKEGTLFPIVQAIAAADLRIVAERELTQSLSLVSASGLAERGREDLRDRRRARGRARHARGAFPTSQHRRRAHTARRVRARAG